MLQINETLNSLESIKNSKSLGRIKDKDNKFKVVKHRNLNNASFDDYTLTDYQVLLALIHKAWLVSKANSPLIQRQYILTAQEFAELFKKNTVNHCYEILKQAEKKLRSINIQVADPNSPVPWNMPACSAAKYEKKEGCIKIEFSDRILPYIGQQTKRFVNYDIPEITRFDSLYTVRLYELIVGFKDTGKLIISVDQLRCAFAVGNKFKVYKDFKKRTFAHACQEINTIYDMELGFKEEKRGGKVIAIEFIFDKTLNNMNAPQITCIESKNDIKSTIEDQSLVEFSQVDYQLMSMQPLLSSSTIHELRDTFHLTDKEILTLSQRRTEDKVNEAIEIIKKKIVWKEEIPDLAAALKEQLTNEINGISSTFPLQSVIEKREIANENKKIIKDSRITSYLSNQQGIWRNICEELVEDIGEVLFVSWILKISFVEIQRDLLILKSITALARDRVKSDYGHKILDIAKQFNAAIGWLKIIS